MKHNEFHGCLVRVTVLSGAQDKPGLVDNKLSKFIGEWQGDDLEECLFVPLGLN